MSRVCLGFFFVLFASLASADAVIMKDGRRLEGQITDKGDKYAIKQKFGTLYVNKADVDKVEMAPTNEYKDKAAALSDKDAEGHFQLALWCKEQGMRAEMVEELNKTLSADPDHAGAHRELGHSKIGERWGTPLEILDSVEALLRLDKGDKARDLLTPIMAGAVDTLDKEAQKRAWLAWTGLEIRAGKMAQAREAMAKWATLVPAQDKVMAQARIRILNDSHDGKYAVKQEDLVAAGLTGSLAGDLKPGRMPLHDERIMNIALRNEAQKDVDKGRALVKDAENAVVAADRDKAFRIYESAEDFFDHASLIVKDYAKSHQIEVVRKLVPIAFELAAISAMKTDECCPLKRKYEMKRNNAGQLKFTPTGLKDFEQTRRDWNVNVGKFEEYLKSINRLNDRFPEELAASKQAYEKFQKMMSKEIPEIRAYFDDCAKSYK